MTTEVQEVFDKTIIHTLPLIKSNSKSLTQPSNGGNTSTVVNFKKFRKVCDSIIYSFESFIFRY